MATSVQRPRIDRRTFLLASFATAAGISAQARAQAPALETFTQWLNASRSARERALQACLDRIAAMDPSIHAWVQVVAAAADRQRRAVRDPVRREGHHRDPRPVHGIRVRRFTADASAPTMRRSSRELRQRGAILLGKTHTTAFAYRTPGPTRNPRNLEHTPGGSSSGSAAAVAAGMVPFALGTQTRGSVLRPASYCGVTGFKASYGLLSLEGVLPLAKSLDTLGFFTHTAADMLALWEAPAIRRAGGRLGAGRARPDARGRARRWRPRFRSTLARLRAAGASIRPSTSPRCWAALPKRAIPSSPTRPLSSTSNASRSTAPASPISRTWFATV